MIKALIFDFGNVFINLDIKTATKHALDSFKVKSLPDELTTTNNLYEQGLITTKEFIAFYTKIFPHLSQKQFLSLWNALLKDFPKHRLEFIQQLKQDKQYTLILLSNTNALHIEHIQKNISFYNDFKNSFDAFYLSHEIGMRKPDKTIFNFVLTENQLNPKQCLFIDDNKDNCTTANNLGINTWHLNPITDDVCTLFKTNNHLF